MTNAKKSRTLAHSRNKMSLNTLGGILNEMARIYRLTINGKIRPDEATKLTFILEKMRSAVESLPVPPQILGLGYGMQINILSVEAGRYVTDEAATRLANGNNILDINPESLLRPVIVKHEPLRITTIKGTAVETTSIDDLFDDYVEASGKVDRGETLVEPAEDVLLNIARSGDPRVTR